MRTSWAKLEPHRLTRRGHIYRSDRGDHFGVFGLPNSGRRGGLLLCIATDGIGPRLPMTWEHVSVHLEIKERELTPNWEEMCLVKDWFWAPHEWVVQFHPAQSDYVNNHAYTLHLWRPVDVPMPVPPPRCV